MAKAGSTPSTPSTRTPTQPGLSVAAGTGVPADVLHEWTDLAEQARGHQFAYHVKDRPTVSDGD